LTVNRSHPVYPDQRTFREKSARRKEVPRAGIQGAVDKGWMVRHESGTYVKFTPSGAELFA
jgi:hypothetical protein